MIYLTAKYNKYHRHRLGIIRYTTGFRDIDDKTNIFNDNGYIISMTATPVWFKQNGIYVEDNMIHSLVRSDHFDEVELPNKGSHYHYRLLDWTDIPLYIVSINIQKPEELHLVRRCNKWSFVMGEL